MHKSDVIILRGEVTLDLLKPETLRIGKHIVKASALLRPTGHHEPRIWLVWLGVWIEDYSKSGMRLIH